MALGLRVVDCRHDWSAWMYMLQVWGWVLRGLGFRGWGLAVMGSFCGGLIILVSGSELAEE